MGLIKETIKHYTPPDVWSRWSGRKQRASKFLREMRYAKRLGKGSPRQLFNFCKILIKEKLNVQGILDYPDQQIRMAVDTRKQAWRLFACKKEPETVEWIKSFIKPGDAFYDVGANVGAYSFVACAASGHTCRVFAFEPGFSTYEALVRNIFLNNFSEKIAPYPIALGEQTGVSVFHYFGIEAGMASHFLRERGMSAKSSFESAYSQPMVCFCMDDFIEIFKIPPPNLMKIDVDGGELGVIRGAELTIRHPGLRSILIEIDKSKKGCEEIIRRIEQAHFRIYSTHKHTEDIYNYIFVKK